MKTHERRGERRVRRADPVQLEWTNNDGSMMRALGHCVDASPSGMRVEILDLLPVGLSVRFDVLGQDFRGMATTKSCRLRGARAVAGFEFAWSKKWKAIA